MDRRPHPRDRGASMMQYVGMTLLAAVIGAGLFTALDPGAPARLFSQATCAILGGEACESAASGPGSHEMTPFERATWGTPWFGGDSFASGEGVGNYQADTDVTGWNWRNPGTWWQNPFNVPDRNMCHRSNDSYQAQAFAALQGNGAFQGQQYSSEACSGATVSDLYSDNHNGNAGEGPQMQSTPAPNALQSGPFDNVPDDASLIQLSMGGNDVGFGDILTNCVTGLGSGCMDSDAAQAAIDRVYGTDSTPGELELQLAKLVEEHPDARIVIMGYPQLFSEKPLTTEGPFGITLPQWNGSGMTVEEQRWANQQSDAINVSIRAMCDRLGIEFIDPTSLYVGPGYDHRIGSDEPWINGLSAGSNSGDWTVNNASFHPNKAGHDAMAGLLLQHIHEGPK